MPPWLSIDSILRRMLRHILRRFRCHCSDVPFHDRIIFVVSLTVVSSKLAPLRQEMDKKYQPTWHCIVGRNCKWHVKSCRQCSIC